MPLEREFLEMMPHLVTIVPWVEQDFHGNPVYDETKAKTYRARVVGKGLALRRREGEENTVIFDVYLDTGNDVVKQEDKVILPDDLVWLDQTPEIFSIGRFPDDYGHHHTKIQCGWMYHRQGQ